MMPDAAAIYTRFSTERQDARSIDDQLRRCREYAARTGYVVGAEFADKAVSGAHLERADLRQMLDLARSPQRPFRAVLVDDLSRLSRDLGATWNIIFGELAAANVKVIDVSTGMASDDPNARVTFGAKALVNDMFLQIVRAQTHRGLEGRALGGFWTGGRVYGYTTVTEENPPDPLHPRKVSVIHKEEAIVVRRVFQMYLAGNGLKRIASTLNSQGVPAPHDNGRGNKNGRGWGHTSIGNMLKNERYIGRWTWNTNKWVPVPGKRSRRRVKRPERDHVARELPQLAIIDKETWDAVEAKRTRSYRVRGGRPPGSGTYGAYVTSGLLRCGVCGGSMSIVGARMKKGVRYATFGCLAHHSRGPSICDNSLTISERKATTAVTSSIARFLTQKSVIDRIILEVTKRLGESVTTPDIQSAESVVLRVENRLRNVTDALAKAGPSRALLDQLRSEQAHLDGAKEGLSRARTQAQPMSIPSDAVIRGYLVDLANTLKADPARGRELLAKHITPVMMTPKEEGPGRHYVGTGAFMFSPVLENVSSGGKPVRLSRTDEGLPFEFATLRVA